MPDRSDEPQRPLRALIVDDSPTDVELMLLELSRQAYAPDWLRVATAEALAQALQAREWDIVLCDYSMPGFGGLEALAIVKGSGLDLPFVFVSGTVGEEIAVAAIRAGAHDYLLKDRLARLGPAVARELLEAAERRERRRAEAALRSRTTAMEAAARSRLRQAQRMEAIGRLAGGVAHDFNNVLGVVLGRAEIALRQAEPDSPLRRHLEAIREATLRSAALTRQLLAFARQEAIAPRPLDLAAAAAAALRMLRPLIGENVRLGFEAQPGLPAVLADPSQIDQALTNLVVNARDAITGPGAIAVAVSAASLSAEDCARRPGCAPGNYVVLSVADDGRGMAAEEAEHVFEPFFTTRPAGNGTGLGLATVYAIASQNRGFVEVDSAPGQGSRFRLYFPVLPEAGG